MSSYIDLINKFWSKDEAQCFCSTDTKVYFYLLAMFNKQGWPESVEATNARMAANIGLSENTFKQARMRLKDVGMIDFEASKTRASKTRYVLCGMTAIKVSKIDTDTDGKEEKVSKIDSIGVDKVSKIDTDTDGKEVLVSGKLSKNLSESVSIFDTPNKTKTKTLKEKINKKENGGEGSTRPHTPTHEGLVLKFYTFIRESAPFIAANITLPTKRQVVWLYERYNESDIKVRVMRIENNKKVRSNIASLFPKLNDWLTEDWEKGKIKRIDIKTVSEEAQPRMAENGGAENGKMRKTSDEDAKANYINLLMIDAKRGKQNAVEELRKLGVSFEEIKEQAYG